MLAKIAIKAKPFQDKLERVSDGIYMLFKLLFMMMISYYSNILTTLDETF
jgi:hypothetical protein